VKCCKKTTIYLTPALIDVTYYKSESRESLSFRFGPTSYVLSYEKFKSIDLGIQPLSSEESYSPLSANSIPPGDEASVEKPWHHLIHYLPLGVVVFDMDLRITDSNPVAEMILLSSTNVAEALTLGAKQDDGHNWENSLKEVIASAKPCTFENITYSKDKRNYILQIICTPLTNRYDGRLVGGILLVDDITAKVGMERDLASAERLAAVGKLAARVAHELNNPLDGILRYINLALRLVDQEGPERANHYLQESRKGLMRMVEIISELLEFSRSTFSAFEEADINKIVEDAAKSMGSLASKNDVSVNRHYGPDMPNIRSSNLFQVFCNLTKNAINAMEGGGELTISTYCDEHDMLIEFADTGPGISDEIKKSLFEPFFTTKEPGKGTGLGLAICKDIVERFSGKIEATNREQGGCVFVVSIPLTRTSRGQ
jgi:signal transduction histidine kinase